MSFQMPNSSIVRFAVLRRFCPQSKVVTVQRSLIAATFRSTSLSKETSVLLFQISL